MKFLISKDVQNIGVKNPVACIISNVHVHQTDVLDDEIARLLKIISEDGEEILNSSVMKGFSALFSKLGYPNQKPAGQRLLESFQKNGFKKYNNIVDACNISSARYGCGLGLHDASKVNGDIAVFRATEIETIKPLFKSEQIKVNKGDLVYGDVFLNENKTNSLLAWLGKRDIDSDDFKITETTTKLLLVALGNASTSKDYSQAICNNVFKLVSKSCPKAEFSVLETITYG